jgi:hypothetical protein
MADHENSFQMYVNVGVIIPPPAEEPTQVYTNIGFLLPTITVTRVGAGWGVTPIVSGTTVLPGAASSEAQVYQNVT